ncbi:hypothetical protein ACFFX0_32240 [Citricoccus parietis]|uniref:Uncharacterized protein n=1 Tax=Citricoccus parietis TaxID=592307 RepID=A0ABV5G9E3_9MICC
MQDQCPQQGYRSRLGGQSFHRPTSVSSGPRSITYGVRRGDSRGPSQGLGDMWGASCAASVETKPSRA